MSKTLRWLSAHPLRVEPLVLETGRSENVVIRLLQPTDAASLDRFIGEGLSPASRLRFGAHRPEHPSAEVCRNIGKDDTLRIVATLGDKIVGYLILQGTIPEKEVARYVTYGRPEDVAPGTVRLAPAVADEVHGQGIGKSLVQFATSIAHQLRISRIVLWGGTHDDNGRGRALYERTGFRYAGSFETRNANLNPDGPVLNHDMVLNVEDAVAADAPLAVRARIVSKPGSLGGPQGPTPD